MLNRSKYVFGAALASMALANVSGLVREAHASLMTAADFTFDSLASGGSSSQSAAGFVTGVSFGADVGIGTAYGFHSVGGTFTATAAGGVTLTNTALPGATVYSDPAGNGTTRALSAQNWAPGDYYRFAVPTTTITGVMVKFDQVGSATGPGVFSLLYSVDGTTFSTFTTYTIPTGPISSFASGSSATNLSFSFDLSGITGLNGDSKALFEVVDAATTPYGTSATPGTAGTDRIDSVIISGNTIVVPEPAALTLLTVAAAAALYRRPRQHA